MEKRKIYVLCPDTRHPSGGVKQLFRLVDNLNNLGFDAVIIRRNRFKVIKWFNYSTKIEYFPYVYFLISQLVRKKRKQDHWMFKLLNIFWFRRSMPAEGAIIVIPEIYAFGIGDILKGYRHVIFNQNCFLTFEGASKENVQLTDPYLNERMLACMVVSNHSREYLSFVYPNISLYRIRLGISEFFSSNQSKKKQIAFMPRKLNEDSQQVLQIIQRRNMLKEWSFVAIDNVAEEEVANILGESLIFLSFNYQEGLGLPPLEAMACGCYVIGYAGQAGKEYLLPEFSTLVQDRDVVSFVHEIEKITQLYASNPEEILQKGDRASRYVKFTYNHENELKDTRAIWNAIFDKKLNQ